MKKQFKTESKKMLDMMINSVYTHKEIFLRELISNASDAIDKRYFKALTDASKTPEGGYEINIVADKDARTLTIIDNGCGMTEEELEKNLGTIAKSGSGEFKKENGQEETIDIIGQFGVGFYSAFMVCDRICVYSRSVDGEGAFKWESTGADGYTVEPCDYSEYGSKIVLYIKEDTDTDNYTEYLSEHTIRSLVKKYSDYIRYPVKTAVTKSRKVEKEDSDAEPEYEQYTEIETLNSMVPLWHRSPQDITKEEYNSFYQDKFYDYVEPASVIHFKAEGTVSFESLLYIPKKAPMNYYNKSFEKGLQLYSSGVMITECCDSLLPDYFSFVKGLADSPDLKLNISRETLQHDHQLKVIAKNIEKKIKAELTKIMNNERSLYEEFYGEFGLQLKYGLYSSYGMNKDVLQDLLLFKSAKEDKYISLKEYVEGMDSEQKNIYYACGESADSAKMLPQTDAVLTKGYDVLLFTDEVDEFTISMLREYDGKQFMNVCAENLDISTDEEKNAIKEFNETNKGLLDALKERLSEGVSSVKFTNTLGEHPVCLSSEGGISTEMEKVLSKMPGANGEFAPKAEIVLEINSAHPIAQRLIELYDSDKELLGEYGEILYAQARLISGLSVNNPTELADKICKLMVK